MNRRNFLRLSSGLIVASQVAPSLIWPFRKFFIPPPMKQYGVITVGNSMFMEGGGNSELEAVLAEELGRIWDKVIANGNEDYTSGRRALSLRVFDSPTELEVFYDEGKVKAQDPETYRILYGNASTNRA
jgi:hypothetical protein